VKTKFQPYDVVRVVHLPSQTAGGTADGFRAPRVGDTGAVVMVYEQPSEGYTVEAVACDGSTEWLVDFLPDDLERV
jgi:hypothetical protein